MKKSAAFLLACSSLAWNAHGQSNVTLYGIMDQSLRRVMNGNDHRTEIASGGMAASRFGVRGVEDLGQGLKAEFVLESQISADTGTVSSKFFGRRSTIGLISATAGEIRIGRDFSPNYRVGTLIADPFGNAGMGAVDTIASTQSFNGATYNTHARLDNSITYFLPNTLGGVYGQVTTAAGEKTSGNAYNGGLLGYRNKQLDIAVAYGQTRITQDWLKENSAAVSYDIKVARLMAAWSQIKYQAATEDHYNIGVNVPMGPGSIRALWATSKGSGGTLSADGADNQASKLALGYVYDLSKRTALYATATRIKNRGGAAFTFAPGAALANGSTSTGYDLGIRHMF